MNGSIGRDALTSPQHRRPRVVAHRGASDELAEHTMGAYRQALADGADALECDVRLTRDGHLVCVHDRRLERTSSGRGVVSTKRLEELQHLDWASWKNPWADLDDEAELPDVDLRTVLTLRELFTMVRDHPDPVEVFVETKHPTRYSGWVEQRLVELLREFGWAGRRPEPGPAPRRSRVDAAAPRADTSPTPVRVLSYSQLSLRRLRRWAPDIALAWVVDEEIPVRVRRCELPRGVSSIAVACDLVRQNPGWVHRMHDSGHGVWVWVVNHAEDLRLCRDLGVEAVITDRPRFARKVLAEPGSAGSERPP
jgi:glycerophosphoryl diester phosphodiesterase